MIRTVSFTAVRNVNVLPASDMNTDTGDIGLCDYFATVANSYDTVALSDSVTCWIS